MHTIAYTLLAGLLGNSAPVATQPDFAFLAGSWKASIWGGVFEEVWSIPKAGNMTQMGRHVKDDNMTFMEFGSVERDKEGNWTMFLMFGQMSKYDQKPIGFKLTEAKKGDLLFVNTKNDFPTHIRYTAKSKTEMTCVIYGRADGKTEREVFNFKRM